MVETFVFLRRNDNDNDNDNGDDADDDDNDDDDNDDDDNDDDNDDDEDEEEMNSQAWVDEATCETHFKWPDFFVDDLTSRFPKRERILHNGIAVTKCSLSTVNCKISISSQVCLK